MRGESCSMCCSRAPLQVLIAAPRFGKDANEGAAHSHSWSCLLSQHGLRSWRYMELGLAPRRKEPRLGHRAWFCLPFGGTVYARPSPSRLQFRDNATMEKPGPADGTTLPASTGTTWRTQTSS